MCSHVCVCVHTLVLLHQPKTRQPVSHFHCDFQQNKLYLCSGKLVTLILDVGFDDIALILLGSISESDSLVVDSFSTTSESISLLLAPEYTRLSSTCDSSKKGIVDIVEANVVAAQKKQKELYDRKHGKHNVFKVGDLVLRENLRRKKTKGGKLMLPSQ